MKSNVILSGVVASILDNPQVTSASHIPSLYPSL